MSININHYGNNTVRTVPGDDGRGQVENGDVGAPAALPGENLLPGQTAVPDFTEVTNLYIDLESQGAIALDNPRFDLLPDFAVGGTDAQQDSSRLDVYQAAAELAPVDLNALMALLIKTQAEMKMMNREERAADTIMQNQASLGAIEKVEESTKSNFIGSMVSGSMSAASGLASISAGIAGTSTLQNASKAATAIAPAGTTDAATLSAASTAFGNAMQPFAVTQQYTSGLSSTLQSSGQMSQGAMTMRAGEADADKLDQDRQADRAKDKRDIANDMMQSGADTIAKALAAIGQANDAAHQSSMQAANNLV